MRNKIAIIAIALIVVTMTISSAFMIIQSNASKDAALLQVEVDGMRDDLDDLESEFEEIVEENLKLISRNKEVSQETVALEEEIDEVTAQMSQLNKEIPKDDLGIATEYFLGQIGIILKENGNEDGYSAITTLPTKNEAENGNHLATIFISGDETSEDFLKIIIEIDRYNNFMSKVSLSHNNMPDLYSEYKVLLTQGLIMIIESAYYYDEEIIKAADTVISEGEYEDAEAILTEDINEGGAIFTIAPKE